MRLLITRPEHETVALAARLEAMGHTVVCAPLLTIEPLSFDLPAKFDGLVFSSINAVRVLAAKPELENYRGNPVITVGEATAEAARAAGFGDIVSAAGDIGDLGELLRQKYQGQKAKLLYLAGVDRAGDLGTFIGAGGPQIVTIEVYKAEAARSFPEQVEMEIRGGTIDGCILMSPRTASAYVTLIKRAGLVSPAQKLVHYCLSGKVGRPLDSLGLEPDRIKLASTSDLKALLSLVGK